MFKKIVDLKNIKQAYLDVLDAFVSDSKSSTYKGLDGLNIPSFDLDLNDLLSNIKIEIEDFKELDPALKIFIPKKNNPEKNREIFIYNIKERVKAQAIYRVLLPEFEKTFSDRLFSYRPGRSPYRAAQLVSRKYRKSFANNYIFTADLSNFSGEINREIMFDKLKYFSIDNKTLKILSLFIFNKFYYQGKFICPEKGLIIGCPIFGLLTNFYLNDIDKKYSALVNFYLRVGDDLIIFDSDFNKLKKIKESFLKDINELSLKLNKSKVFCGKALEEFSFLGYNFSNGKISLTDNFAKKIKNDFKAILIYKNYSDSFKINIIKKRMNKYSTSFNNYFLNIIKSKPQVNDFDQIKELSEYFFRVLTEFIYLKYSPRNRRLLISKLSKNNIKIKSLYKIFSEFHYERDKKYPRT